MRYKIYYFDSETHYNFIKGLNAFPGLAFFCIAFFFNFGSVIIKDMALIFAFLSIMFIAFPLFANGKILFSEDGLKLFRNGKSVAIYSFEQILEIRLDISMEYNCYSLAFVSDKKSINTIYIDRYFFKSKKKMMQVLMGCIDKNEDLRGKIVFLIKPEASR